MKKRKKNGKKQGETPKEKSSENAEQPINEQVLFQPDSTPDASE